MSFFRRKFGKKIAENCDHNIDPRFHVQFQNLIFLSFINSGNVAKIATASESWVRILANVTYIFC
jgi:hypothetical protein